MFFVRNQVLIVVCTDEILLFNLHIDNTERTTFHVTETKASSQEQEIRERTKNLKWQQYTSIKIHGRVSMVDRCDEF